MVSNLYKKNKGEIEKSAIRKISTRLVPFVALMFFINFLDRTAISFAVPNGMMQDLNIQVAQFGLASGIFFIGYILLEVPSNMALHRFGISSLAVTHHDFLGGCFIIIYVGQ